MYLKSESILSGSYTTDKVQVIGQTCLVLPCRWYLLPTPDIVNSLCGSRPGHVRLWTTSTCLKRTTYTGLVTVWVCREIFEAFYFILFPLMTWTRWAGDPMKEFGLTTNTGLLHWDWPATAAPSKICQHFYKVYWTLDCWTAGPSTPFFLNIL